MKLKRRSAALAVLIAGSALVFTAQAAPPDGKGPGNHPGSYKSLSTHGGNNGANNKHDPNVLRAGDLDNRRRYDDRGRYYDYFDSRRDRQGRFDYDGLWNDLAYAGITAAVARDYALDYDLGGYSPLPPGIRKNLARGKPLPPGIAKKMVPGSLLGRLPSYPGHEWRMAGSDLVLIAISSMIIADILYDVFD